jgi:hypothetical protein
MSAEALNKARDCWLNSFKKDARGLRKKAPYIPPKLSLSLALDSRHCFDRLSNRLTTDYHCYEEDRRLT